MSVAVKNYLKASRDRALGSILGYAEREVYQYLSPADRSEFRSVVIDSLNSYHDRILDLVKSEDETHVRNDEIVDLLERVEHALTLR